MNEMRKLMETINRIQEDSLKKLKDMSTRELRAIWNEGDDERVGAAYAQQLRLIAQELKRRGESLNEDMSYNDEVDYWTHSLEDSIKRKGLWDKALQAADGNIEEVRYAIADEAESITSSYHGTGEGIGTSDINHFIVSIFSQLGVDDVFGWRKPRKGVNETSIEKIGCLKCDEVSTKKAWQKNNGTCPKCNNSTQGVAESMNTSVVNKDIARLRKMAGISEDVVDFKKYQKPLSSRSLSVGTKVRMLPSSNTAKAFNKIGKIGKISSIEKGGKDTLYNIKFDWRIDSLPAYEDEFEVISS